MPASCAPALLHLIDAPGLPDRRAVRPCPGPGFPDRRRLVEPPDAIRQAYATGRGSFRLRARWTTRAAAATASTRSSSPRCRFRCQKGRLIEKIAALLEEKKLPLLADVRDESTEDVRLVLEPKTRNVDADVLMEQLFRADRARNPGAAQPQRARPARRAAGDEPEGGAAGLSRSSPRSCCSGAAGIRLAAVARRMEILRGQIIVYVNLDEVIRIIREEDDPKAEMMARWELTEVQAEAILNMRLRALRRLEEIEIRKELDALAGEEGQLTALLGERQAAMARDRQGGRARPRAEFGGATPLGRRRTEIAAAPAPIEIPAEALVEREPVTVLCSAKGWIRAVQGPQRRGRRAEIQGGRRAALRGARPRPPTG